MSDSSNSDRVAREAVRGGANRAMATIEKAFIKNGSGRYVSLKVDPSPMGDNPASPAPSQKGASRE
jgi:hypothetical protein